MNAAEEPMPAESRPSPWRWWVCGLLFLATTLNYMDRQALSQLGVEIKQALKLDNEEYSRLDSGFSFAFAIGAITTGYIVDRVGVRFVYPFMVLGWSLAGILTGYATGFYSLMACRIMLGYFEAGNWPCGIRTTRAILRLKERSFGNSIFQSGTAIGAILTPSLVFYLVLEAEAAGVPAEESWKEPFLLIGLIGLVWIALWMLTVPSKLLANANESSESAQIASEVSVRFVEIFKDRRFWALLIMVSAINVAWHTFRSWLPIYLRDVREMSKEGMTGLTTGFYITADIGSWAVGLLTWRFIGRGMNGQTARMFVFAGCAGIALIGVAFPFTPTNGLMYAALLVYGFAALGLFPTYFALTQEVSAKHQGLVTGTLGAGAHLFLSLVIYPLEGWYIKETNSFDNVFACAAVFPLMAFIVVAILWRSRPAPSA